MPIELKMPALSPTMEEGTLAKWLVKEGDAVRSGDILAEIETDKATMEFEAVDEGTVAKIVVPEGTDGVKVGEVIALIAGEGEDASASAAAPKSPSPPAGEGDSPKASGVRGEPGDDGASPSPSRSPDGERAPPSPARGERQEGRVKASPLARRLAEAKGIDLSAIQGSGPGGRIVKADIDAAEGKGGLQQAQPSRMEETAAPKSGLPEPVEGFPSSTAAKPAQPFTTEIPHEAVKLSNMRKTIARRLTEAKQTIPHIYLTVDIRLDALLKLRGELNAGLASRGVKLSVNDMLIKALAVSLLEVPECNVSFTPDQLIKYSRADISVAVSIPNGLITPIITDAGNKSISSISKEMAELAGRAKEGKLQPHEYQGGTASLSNMGMFGIKQFEAVINPPQGMIMAIGAGEKRPYVVDDALAVATVMSATGSFDHRAIDGADGARLMQAFKAMVESPLGMVA
jgi:pyruvate dehydrogenase E2 component (dihydrolipoamide acetyltransferase)